MVATIITFIVSRKASHVKEKKSPCKENEALVDCSEDDYMYTGPISCDTKDEETENNEICVDKDEDSDNDDGDVEESTTSEDGASPFYYNSV